MAARGAAAASVATFALFHLPTSLPTSTTADSAGSGSPADAKAAQRSEAAAPSAPVRLNSDTFRSDVRRLLSQQSGRYSVASPGRTPSSDSPENGSDLARGTACRPSTPVAGVVESRDVLLDGKPALLEVFGVTDGSRVVRVLSCDGVETLATARIPAP